MNTRRTTKVAILATAIVMLWAGVSAAAPTQSSAKWSTLRAKFEAMAQVDVVSAIAELREGSSVERFSAGTTELGGKVPAPAGGRYRAGSVTKTFVATVILQLVGEGRMALSDPVEHWLPGVLPNGQAVTIRDLLRHTSGVYDYTWDLLPSDDQVLGIRFTTFTARQLVDIANAHGSQFTPGSQQQYSNTDYILLGMVIGKVTGRPYGEEIQRRIIGPLGLSGTSMPGTFPSIIGPHAHVYVGATGAVDAPPVDVTIMNPSMAGAAGEVISTTSDLNRFFHTLTTGRLLRPTELQQMTDPAGFGFGLGVEIATLDCGVRIIGHGGGGPGFVGLAFTAADGSRQLSLTAAVWGENRDTLTTRVIGAQMQVLYAAFCPAAHA